MSTDKPAIDIEKKPAGEDWDNADIIWALRKRGTSLQRVARQNNLSRTALTSLQQRPWPKGERLVAEAIGLEPRQVWPSRYNRDGTRKHGLGERLLQFPRQHSTRKPAVNVHRKRAA